MTIADLLALYDNGATIEYLIDQILGPSRHHGTRIGKSIVKAALEMPDSAREGARPPVIDEIGPDRLEVADTVIVVGGAAPQESKDNPKAHILLSIADAESEARRNAALRTRSARLSVFVDQIVTLRAAGSKALVRTWLESLGQRLAIE